MAAAAAGAGAAVAAGAAAAVAPWLSEGMTGHNRQQQTAAAGALALPQRCAALHIPERLPHRRASWYPRCMPQSSMRVRPPSRMTTQLLPTSWPAPASGGDRTEARHGVFAGTAARASRASQHIRTAIHTKYKHAHCGRSDRGRAAQCHSDGSCACANAATVAAGP
jgi:hypothetical protein